MAFSFSLQHSVNSPPEPHRGTAMQAPLAPLAPLVSAINTLYAVSVICLERYHTARYFLPESKAKVSIAPRNQKEASLAEP
uniref:Uncharacterized protein n=1 Tax=Knipowitschia caucasica TaxID=637954 RepID=A0AAV2KGX9_KNICA